MNTKESIQFDSANLGNTKVANQQDPFAAQNQVAQAKQQQSSKTRKKVLIILAVAVGVILIGLITWLAILMAHTDDSSSSDAPITKTDPTIVDASDAGIAKLRELAQAKYNSSKRVADVNRLFSAEAELTDPAYLGQLRLAQILFYVGNGFYQAAVDLSAQINPAELPLTQRGMFYDAMYNTYTGLKDSAKAGEYFALSYGVQVEIQGYDEGDDGRDGI